MHDKTHLFSFFFLVILISCKHVQNPEDLYGTKYNNEREKIGLKTLNSQWVSSFENNNKIIWNPENLDSIKNTGKAFYAEKKIGLKNDTLIFETDIFSGPESFTKSENFELLYYVYYYIPDEMIPVGWMYNVIKKTGEDEIGMDVCSSTYITKNEADSILNSWGLKYK